MELNGALKVVRPTPFWSDLNRGRTAARPRGYWAGLTCPTGPTEFFPYMRAPARPRAHTQARVRAYTRACLHTYRSDRLDRLDQARYGAGSLWSDLAEGRTKMPEVGPHG